jgi:hypothetical protein
VQLYRFIGQWPHAYNHHRGATLCARRSYVLSTNANHFMMVDLGYAKVEPACSEAKSGAALMIVPDVASLIRATLALRRGKHDEPR